MASIIYVLRHAKSDWSQRLADFDRPLNKRGENTVPVVAAYLQQHNIMPDKIYSSPAQRAKQTIEGIAKLINFPLGHIVWDQRLYLASLDELLMLLDEWSRPNQSLMVVGHNPGLEQLVEYLSTTEQGDFPTAAFAQIQIAEGVEIGQGCAQQCEVVRPRDLI